MPAKLLDGKLLAQKIQEELRAEIHQLRETTRLMPRFVSILVGEDPGSAVYANSQKRLAEKLGIGCDLVILSKDISEEQLIETVRGLNQDTSVHGIMIQKPLPSHIDEQIIADTVAGIKDWEGVNTVNMGNLVLGQSKIIPCTPASVMAHIHSTGIKGRGKEAVIVGRSEIVGKPLILLLLKESMTVTVCHSGTSDAGRLAEHVGRADVLVVAMGRARFIKGEWVKQGALVVDVGINQVDGKIVGDVEFEPAQERAAFITPVPGGVGPVTVTMLMRNGVESFKWQCRAQGVLQSA